MPKALPTSFPQVYAAVADELRKRIGDAMAIQAGPPTSEPLVPNTEELQVKAWNERNPRATDEAMQQLAVQKYQEHVQSGMTPDIAQRATAEDLTHFRYGGRLKLYTHGQVDYEEQIAEAKRLAKLAARENTPNPPLPPPTMPSAALTNLTTMGAPVPPGLAAPTVASPDAAAGEAGAVLPKPTGGPSPLPAIPPASMPPTGPEPPAPGGY